MSKKAKRLSKEEQLELRNRARAELLRIDTLVSDLSVKEMIEEFKYKYSVCEIVYKVILDSHQFNKTGVHNQRLIVDMRQVPHALKYAGYDFDNGMLSHLFGAEDKNGQRSVKKLRDSLTHNLSDAAVKELRDRETELNGYMDSFLSKVRCFDVVT